VLAPTFSGWQRQIRIKQIHVEPRAAGIFDRVVVRIHRAYGVAPTGGGKEYFSHPAVR
jgi:hypothetical protein